MHTHYSSTLLLIVELVSAVAVVAAGSVTQDITIKYLVITALPFWLLTEGTV